VERSAAARAALESIPDERFAPFDRRTALAVSEIVTCRSWPSGTAVAPRFDAPLPDVPTLLLAGTADLRTPLEDAAAVARQLPRAQLVAVPGTGHAVTFHGIDCVGSAVARFFAGEQAERCPEVTPPAAAQPVPHPARAVSVLPATTLTVRDVLGQLQFTLLTKSAFSLKGLFIRAGGLRGGRYSATTRALTLERVTVVPGVAVSGRIEGRVDPFDGTIAGARGVLRVRAGARSGTLTLGDGRVTGRLGGRPVDAPLSLAG
jgi:hypothetical protein